MIRLNPTRLRRFLTCEYDWFCYAVLGVVRRVRRSYAALDRGKGLHALLEYAIKHYAEHNTVYAFEGEDGWHVASDIYQKLFDSEAVRLDEETCVDLLDAARYHIPLLNLPQCEVLKIGDVWAVELELFAPVPCEAAGAEGVVTDIELQAIIDVVFRHRETGRIWLLDWKTTEDAIDTAQMLPRIEHNEQLAIERMILAHHGIIVDVSAIVVLRSTAPRPPEVTSRGKVTRNKAKLACDWPTYEQAIQDNGEDVSAEDVQDVREALLTATFVRWRIDITSPNGDAALRTQIEYAAQRMRALAVGDAEPLRNLRDDSGKASRGCKSCDYQKWCTASLRQNNVIADGLLGLEYVAKPDSKLVHLTNYSTAPSDPAHAYVAYVAQLGRIIEPHEEYRP